MSSKTVFPWRWFLRIPILQTICRRLLLLLVTKDELFNLLLEYQNKFTTTLASIEKWHWQLKKRFLKIESDLAITRNVNSKLKERMASSERHCWSNSQYSRGDGLIRGDKRIPWISEKWRSGGNSTEDLWKVGRGCRSIKCNGPSLGGKWD